MSTTSSPLRMSARRKWRRFLTASGLSIVVAAEAAASHGLAAQQPTPTQAAVEAELRRNTQDLLDAVAPGNRGVWDRLLDSAAFQVDENDVVRGKAEILSGLEPLGPGLVGHLAIDDFKLVLHGNVAVVTHEDKEFLDYHGQVIRSRFRTTDTWLKEGTDWRQIASQALAVQQDPPSIRLDHATLCSYAGRYALTGTIVATLRCAGDSLVMERPGRPARTFVPEARDVFFEPGAPRTRRIFQYDELGHLTAFVDRREARDITWKRIGTAE